MRKVIISQINITNIEVSGHQNYANGDFIPLFLDVLQAIALNVSVNPTTLRVFLYILTTVDRNNYVRIDAQEIVYLLNIGKTSVYKAINQLIAMNVLCQESNQELHKRFKKWRKFRLNLYVMNPRVGYRGNTRKINKHLAPAVMQPDGLTPLLPSTNKREFEYIDYDRDEQV